MHEINWNRKIHFRIAADMLGANLCHFAGGIAKKKYNVDVFLNVLGCDLNKFCG